MSPACHSCRVIYCPVETFHNLLFSLQDGEVNGDVDSEDDEEDEDDEGDDGE